MIATPRRTRKSTTPTLWAGGIPPAADSDDRLSKKDLRVLGVLARHENNVGHFCYLKQDTIAEKTGIARPNVARHIARLERFGYVLRGRVDTGKGQWRKGYLIVRHRDGECVNGKHRPNAEGKLTVKGSSYQRFECDLNDTSRSRPQCISGDTSTGGQNDTVGVSFSTTSDPDSPSHSAKNGPKSNRDYLLTIDNTTAPTRLQRDATAREDAGRASSRAEPEGDSLPAEVGNDGSRHDHEAEDWEPSPEEEAWNFQATVGAGPSSEDEACVTNTHAGDGPRRAAATASDGPRPDHHRRRKLSAPPTPEGQATDRAVPTGPQPIVNAPKTDSSQTTPPRVMSREEEEAAAKRQAEAARRRAKEEAEAAAAEARRRRAEAAYQAKADKAKAEADIVAQVVAWCEDDPLGYGACTLDEITEGAETGSDGTRRAVEYLLATGRMKRSGTEAYRLLPPPEDDDEVDII